MKFEKFSIDNRLRIIERFLLFFTMLVFSYINLSNKDIILKQLGDFGLFFNIIIFFVSFPFVIFDFVFLFVSVSIQFGYQLDNFIKSTRSWITYPFIVFIIITAILLVRFYFGIEWKAILPPILSGFIILLITQAPKISSWIKNRFEPK